MKINITNRDIERVIGDRNEQIIDLSYIADQLHVSLTDLLDFCLALNRNQTNKSNRLFRKGIKEYKMSSLSSTFNFRLLEKPMIYIERKKHHD